MTDISPFEPGTIERLLNPTRGDALATAGTIIHYLASTPARLADFCAYVSHCPGDIDPPLAAAVLAATHDELCPGCPDTVTPP